MKEAARSAVAFSAHLKPRKSGRSSTRVRLSDGGFSTVIEEPYRPSAAVVLMVRRDASEKGKVWSLPQPGFPGVTRNRVAIDFGVPEGDRK